jgi:biopolymer transport protein TolR
MGFQVSSNKKGQISEINVTPLVDVMLVLLVIFMVTAPMMFNGVALKLPKTAKVQSLNLQPNQLILTITATEEYFVGKDPVPPRELLERIREQMKVLKVDVLYLRADYSLKYEKVAKLIANLKRSGLSNIALVTEIEKGASQ